jgi:hypothetical protein
MACKGPGGDWTDEDAVPAGYIRLYVMRNGVQIPFCQFGLTEDRMLRITFNEELAMTQQAARFVEAVKSHIEIWEQR